MNKDIISVVFGTLVMFMFVIFMFGSFNESQEIKLLQNQIQVDSTILHHQIVLEINDSLIKHEQHQIRKILNYQNSELKKLTKSIESIASEN